MFNLNEDEEELTHYGQSLSSIEKFEDPEESDSEEEDVEKGLFGKTSNFNLRIIKGYTRGHSFQIVVRYPFS